MIRPKRFLPEKACDRCGITKSAEEFPKVRGGGTTDVCSECKRRAVSEAMLEYHGRALKLALKQNETHFEEDLRRQQERWDALPDGHPYKSPRRPGSS